jgi:hypothetical protein
MSHHGELMARLNAKNVRFDVGAGGGAPDLTPQDIAAALGFTPNGAGVELVVHVYWPDGAKRRRDALLAMLTHAQLIEHNRREQDVSRALQAVVISTPATKPGATHQYSVAHLARWPLWITKLEPLEVAEGYRHICLGVLEELAHPRACPVCNGRELRTRRGTKKTCERCFGYGKVSYGPSWRAKRLGMQRAAFVERWQAPYLWLLDYAREEMQDAETLLKRALQN